MNFTSVNESKQHSSEDITFPETLQAVIFSIRVTECIFGLIGNILSLIIWSRGKNSSKLACSTYFKFLSASEIFCLSFILFHTVQAFTELIPFSWDTYCLYDFFFPFAPQLSTWVIVCICGERMASLCFPLKFHTQGSHRRAKIAFLFFLLTLTAINLLKTIACFIAKGHKYKILHILSEIKLLDEISFIYVFCVVPFLLITTCNTITVVKLCKRRISDIHGGRRQNILTKFTRLSLGSGILHCISVLPTMLRHILYKTLSEKEDEILVTVASSTLYLNNSLNFLLYSFTSKEFRNDFKELLRCRR